MTYVISTDASLSRLWPITRHAALVMPLGAPQSISVPKIHPKNSCFGNKRKNIAPTVASLDAQSLCSSKNETIRSYICASTTYALPIAKKKKFASRLAPDLVRAIPPSFCTLRLTRILICLASRVADCSLRTSSDVRQAETTASIPPSSALIAPCSVDP